MAGHLGAAGLAELWSRVRAYVDSRSAGQLTPPVGFCACGDADPSAAGYSGTWLPVARVACDAFPGAGLHPGPATWPGGTDTTLWRRVK